MTYYESKGLGYDYIRESAKEIAKTTPEMLKNAAKKYLSKMAIIVSYPSDNVKRTVE